MAPVAQAGIFDLTFREDQKPRVTPPHVNKPIPPRYERGMYYDTVAGSTWSNYYGRPDLQLADGLDGASKVLRTRPQNSFHGAAATTAESQQAVPPKWQRAAPVNQYYQQNPHPNFGEGYGPAAIPPGHQALAWRMYMNQLADQQNTTRIGEPGQLNRSYASSAASSGQIGVKTAIGQPKHPWDVQQPQPIDYETLLRRQNAQASLQPVTIENGDADQMASGMDYNAAMNPTDAAMMPPQGMDLPYNYLVQQGDTLSTISQQPQIYADWTLWPLIYDANQPELTDPDLLYPQQNLAIPRDYSTDQATNARGRARDRTPPVSLTDGR